ncbi:MAG: RraA family protein [Candidatus Omnitrophica bacterium]|nr:RraA family protein [Candidatus Omnitrophota bacterium]
MAGTIVQYLRRNRVSTTEVADALGKTGVLPGLLPITPHEFRVGRARCIFTAHDSNHDLHDQIRQVREGDVVIVFAHACEGRALLGDLVARYLLLYRGAEALVVDGLVRDAARLRRERYPVWARGATPLGCHNVPAAPFPAEQAAALRRAMDGGIAICDDGGVTVIGAHQLTTDILERLKLIELQEDIWYYCLNTLKWDTKRIVCDKEYLKQRELLPPAYRDRFDQGGQPLKAVRSKGSRAAKQLVKSRSP